VEVIEGEIIPIEVKSGAVGTLRSLKQFMIDHKSKLGVRISILPLQLDKNILSVPLYMIRRIPRLIKEALTQLK